MWASVWEDVRHGIFVSVRPDWIGFLIPTTAVAVSLIGWWRGAKTIGSVGAMLGTISLAAIILIASRTW